MNINKIKSYNSLQIQKAQRANFQQKIQKSKTEQIKLDKQVIRKIKYQGNNKSEVDRLGRIVVESSSGVSSQQSQPSQPEEPSKPAPPSPPAQVFKGYSVEYFAKLVYGLGSLYFLDKALTIYFAKNAISFNPSIAGLFVVLGSLLTMQAVSPGAVEIVQDTYQSALQWIAKWMSLFYSPILITLPLAVKGISTQTLGKIGVCCVSGMLFSLILTAQATMSIRKFTGTELQDPPVGKPISPFRPFHQYLWTGLLAGSLLGYKYLGQYAQQFVALYGVAATVLAYIIGVSFPKNVQTFLHPIVSTGLIGNAFLALFGKINSIPYEETLKMYLTKNKDMSLFGGGDYLMSMLGVVIVSFGFKIFEQRKLCVRHYREIFGSVILCVTSSMFFTAYVAKFIGLPSVLARSVLPRSITMALAIPIAQKLEANVAIAAASVIVTCLVGAATLSQILSALGFKDPIARGLAASGSSGAFGTAALAAKEPEAIPFAGLAYSLIGITATTLIQFDWFRAALISITG